jgi:endonuclease III
MTKIAEKEQQDLIAKQYQDEMNKLKQEEMEERNKKKAMQEKYNNELNSQLKEKNKKKQYSVLMSEYERSINDGDIKAYQNMDTANLYAKIPGYNLDNPQEKYIDKAMNIYTPQKKHAKLPD